MTLTLSKSVAITPLGKGNMGGRARALLVRGRAREVMAAKMIANGEPALASPKRFRRELSAKVQPRFRIGDGQGAFLLHDGTERTDDPHMAWFGSADQAAVALVRFAAAAGMRALPVLKLPTSLPRSI